jgi:hypothetical protein
MPERVGKAAVSILYNLPDKGHVVLLTVAPESRLVKLSGKHLNRVPDSASLPRPLAGSDLLVEFEIKAPTNLWIEEPREPAKRLDAPQPLTFLDHSRDGDPFTIVVLELKKALRTLFLGLRLLIIGSILKIAALLVIVSALRPEMLTILVVQAEPDVSPFIPREKKAPRLRKVPLGRLTTIEDVEVVLEEIETKCPLIFFPVAVQIGPICF